MTGGMTVNLVGSVLAFVGCTAFVAVYSLFAPWWRSHVGRLLVGKAVALAVFMAIAVCTYTGAADAEALRVVRGVAAGAFGVLMICQAGLVVRETRRGKTHGHPADTRPVADDLARRRRQGR
jgi:hypothetical protein